MWLKMMGEEERVNGDSDRNRGTPNETVGHSLSGEHWCCVKIGLKQTSNSTDWTLCVGVKTNSYLLEVNNVLLPCDPQVLCSTSRWHLSWNHIIVVTMLPDFTLLLGLFVCCCLLWAPFVTESGCWSVHRESQNRTRDLRLRNSKSSQLSLWVTFLS